MSGHQEELRRQMEAEKMSLDQWNATIATLERQIESIQSSPNADVFTFTLGRLNMQLNNAYEERADAQYRYSQAVRAYRKSLD